MMTSYETCLEYYIYFKVLMINIYVMNYIYNYSFLYNFSKANISVHIETYLISLNFVRFEETAGEVQEGAVG